MLKIYLGCAFVIAIVINLPKFLEMHFMSNDQFVTFFVYYNFCAIPVLLQVIPDIVIVYYGFRIIKQIQLTTTGEDQGIHKY
jgi:hypothetical protein